MLRKRVLLPVPRAPNKKKLCDSSMLIILLFILRYFNRYSEYVLENTEGATAKRNLRGQQR